MMWLMAYGVKHTACQVLWLTLGKLNLTYVYISEWKWITMLQFMMIQCRIYHTDWLKLPVLRHWHKTTSVITLCFPTGATNDITKDWKQQFLYGTNSKNNSEFSMRMYRECFRRSINLNVESTCTHISHSFFLCTRCCPHLNVRFLFFSEIH